MGEPSRVLSSAEAIRAALHEALAAIPLPPECALLDYPAYPNIGDHMIWLGEVLYLTEVRDVKIHAVRSRHETDPLPDGLPILLQGGGNFGDLWPEHQLYRERIVSQHRDRPIVLFPQTIYFRDPANLRRTEAVFNSHPDLTILVRDERSFETARREFGNCRIHLTPDMAFELATRLVIPGSPKPNSAALYHCRTDPEQPPGVSPGYLGLSRLEMSDWIPTRRSLQAIQWELSGRFRGLRAAARLTRESLRDPADRIAEFRSWREWRRHLALNGLPRPALTRNSWSLLHAGTWQFRSYPAIVTNRLHGHILCVLLGIPHVLLPNLYFKNEAFFRTWTRDISFCRFESDPMRAKDALAGLRV